MKGKPLYSIQSGPEGWEVLRRPDEGFGGRVVAVYASRTSAEDIVTALRLYADEEI